MGRVEDAERRANLMAIIVERFSLLEYTVRKTLALLMSADPVVAHVFTTQMRAGEMIRRCEEILAESARKNVERGSAGLREALTASKEAFARRNDLFHNLTLQWTEEDGTDVAYTHKWKRGQDEPTLIPAELDNLRAIYHQANHAINGLRVHAPEPPFEMPKPY